MGFFISIFVSLAITVLSELLFARKAERAEIPDLGEMFKKKTEANPIQLIYGTPKVFPEIVFNTKFRQHRITEKVKTGLFSSQRIDKNFINKSDVIYGLGIVNDEAKIRRVYKDSDFTTNFNKAISKNNLDLKRYEGRINYGSAADIKALEGAQVISNNKSTKESDGYYLNAYAFIGDDTMNTACKHITGDMWTKCPNLLFVFCPNGWFSSGASPAYNFGFAVENIPNPEIPLTTKEMHYIIDEYNDKTANPISVFAEVMLKTGDEIDNVSFAEAINYCKMKEIGVSLLVNQFELDNLKEKIEKAAGVRLFKKENRWHVAIIGKNETLRITEKDILRIEELETSNGNNVGTVKYTFSDADANYNPHSFLSKRYSDRKSLDTLTIDMQDYVTSPNIAHKIARRDYLLDFGFVRNLKITFKRNIQSQLFVGSQVLINTGDYLVDGLYYVSNREIPKLINSSATKFTLIEVFPSLNFESKIRPVPVVKEPSLGQPLDLHDDFLIKLPFSLAEFLEIPMDENDKRDITYAVSNKKRTDAETLKVTWGLTEQDSEAVTVRAGILKVAERRGFDSFDNPIVRLEIHSDDHAKFEVDKRSLIAFRTLGSSYVSFGYSYSKNDKKTSDGKHYVEMYVNEFGNNRIVASDSTNPTLVYNLANFPSFDGDTESATIYQELLNLDKIDEKKVYKLNNGDI